MERKKTSNITITCFILLAFSLLFAIIFPAAKNAYDFSFYTICSSHIQQIALGYCLYTEENYHVPSKELWCDILRSHIEEIEDDVFLCPRDKVGPCSYSMNENISEDATVLPWDLVVLFESGPGWNAVGGADDVVTDRHKRAGANIAFADGRVEFVEADAIPNLRWTVEAEKFETPNTKSQTHSNP